ncbi:MAG: hypothetical protein EOP54_18990, partial [Sphingobacteriales bacterium]
MTRNSSIFQNPAFPFRHAPPYPFQKPGNPPAVPAKPKPGTGRQASGMRQNSNLQNPNPMPRGDKSKYTDKQKRQAEHIEEGY